MVGAPTNQAFSLFFPHYRFSLGAWGQVERKQVIQGGLRDERQCNTGQGAQHIGLVLFLRIRSVEIMRVGTAGYIGVR